MKNRAIFFLFFLILVFSACSTVAVKEQADYRETDKFRADNAIVCVTDIDADGNMEYIHRYDPRSEQSPVIYTRVSGKFVKITADKGIMKQKDASYELVAQPAALRTDKDTYLVYSFRINRDCGADSEGMNYSAGGLILVYGYDGKSLSYVKGFVHDETTPVEDCDKNYSGDHKSYEKVKLDRGGAGVVSNTGADEILVYPENSKGVFGFIDKDLKFTGNALPAAAAGQETTFFGSPMYVFDYCRKGNDLIIAYYSFPLALWSLKYGNITCGRHDILGPSNCRLDCEYGAAIYSFYADGKTRELKAVFDFEKKTMGFKPMQEK